MTGAAGIALGQDTGALFANTDSLAAAVGEASRLTGVWGERGQWSCHVAMQPRNVVGTYAKAGVTVLLCLGLTGHGCVMRQPQTLQAESVAGNQDSFIITEPAPASSCSVALVAHRGEVVEVAPQP